MSEPTTDISDISDTAVATDAAGTTDTTDTAGTADATGPGPGDLASSADAFEARLALMRHRQREDEGRRHLWHAHHWPADYGQRCVRIGSRHWCRRCLALYPLGLLVAVLSAAGLAPWPASLDPAPIWLLSLPATVAFVGEAVGVFAYRPRWQVATTLLAAIAFGRALGYELIDRWHPWFWQPIAIFGGIWFLASVFQARTARPARPFERAGLIDPLDGRATGRPAERSDQ